MNYCIVLYVPLKFEIVCIYHCLMCIYTVDDYLVRSVTKRKVNKLANIAQCEQFHMKGSHEHQPRNVSVYVIIMFCTHGVNF